MNARRLTLAIAALTVVATTQFAQAEPWTFFDWTQPLVRADYAPPVTPAVATPRQRIATVVNAEPRRPAPRMLIIGIGF